MSSREGSGAVVIPLRRPGSAEEIDGLSSSFVALYREHYPRVVRALELSGARAGVAEDLAQEAFARTLAHWRRVRNGANPPGYVFKTAFRLAAVRRRRDARPPISLLAPSGDTGAEATTRVSLERALGAMPPARRRCAVLCLIVGLAPRDAAVALKLAPSTVRKQLERARADLRRALTLGEDGGDPDGELAPGS